MRTALILSLFVCSFLTESQAQAPLRAHCNGGEWSSQRNPSAWAPDANRGSQSGRYGFKAQFELRLGPSNLKPLHIHQFFTTEALAVQGFNRVRAALPMEAQLVYLVWVQPNHEQSGIGQ